MRLALALVTLAVADTAHCQDTIRPGYWESVDRVLSPISSTKVDHRCIAAKDVARFMTCYINHHYTCDCPQKSYSDGQIRFRGVCVDHKGAKVGVIGVGTYTATTLHMTAEVTFKLAGLPLTGRASSDAHRLGDVCPAGASTR